MKSKKYSLLKESVFANFFKSCKKWIYKTLWGIALVMEHKIANQIMCKL